MSVNLQVSVFVCLCVCLSALDCVCVPVSTSCEPSPSDYELAPSRKRPQSEKETQVILSTCQHPKSPKNPDLNVSPHPSASRSLLLLRRFLREIRRGRRRAQRDVGDLKTHSILMHSMIRMHTHAYADISFSVCQSVILSFRLFGYLFVRLHACVHVYMYVFVCV